MGDTNKNKVESKKKITKSFTINSLSKKVLSLEKKINTLRKLENIDKKIDRKLKQNISSQKKELSEFKENILKKINSLEKEFDKKIDKMYINFATERDLKLNITKINLKLNKFNSLLKDSRKDLEDLKANLQNIESLINNVQKQNIEVTQKINSFNKKLSEKATVVEVSRLFTEYDNLSDLTNSLEKQLTHILNRLRKIEKIFDQAQVQEEEILSLVNDLEEVGGINE